MVRQYDRSNSSALKDIRGFGNQVGRLEMNSSSVWMSARLPK